VRFHLRVQDQSALEESKMASKRKKPHAAKIKTKRRKVIHRNEKRAEPVNSASLLPPHSYP
jgi:hypothetical protein